MTALIQQFAMGTNTIRVRGTNDQPIFCAKDVCDALAIVNHRAKVARLDADERLTYVQRTAGQRRNMLFVTEPGLYKIILSCREASIPGTAPHAFTRWVTHTILPTLRRQGRVEIERTVRIEYEDEKARRLWCVLKNMNVWNFHARKRHFGKVCRDTSALCYLDSQNSPHVTADNLEAVRATIRTTMATAIQNAVPEDQSRMTDYFDTQ